MSVELIVIAADILEQTENELFEGNEVFNRVILDHIVQSVVPEARDRA